MVLIEIQRRRRGLQRFSRQGAPGSESCSRQHAMGIVGFAGSWMRDSGQEYVGPMQFAWLQKQGCKLHFLHEASTTQNREFEVALRHMGAFSSACHQVRKCKFIGAKGKRPIHPRRLTSPRASGMCSSNPVTKYTSTYWQAPLISGQVLLGRRSELAIPPLTLWICARLQG